ncbi:MAG: hypothetical protein ABR600_03030 [Actinomycetota bacterium]
MSRRSIGFPGLLLLLAAACGGGGGNETPTATPAAGGNSIDVKMQEFAFVPSGMAQRGALTINFSNVGKQSHMAVIGRLDAGKTVADVQKLLTSNSNSNPKWFHNSPADDPLITPGESSGITIHASKPGTYVMLCFVTDPKTHKPHALLGMLGSFEVANSGSAASAPKPDATFTVTKTKLKTENLSAGESVIDVTGVTDNRQFIIMQLDKGKTFKDLSNWFNKGIGNPPARIFGGTSIAGGATGIATFDLKPGTYTAVVAPAGKGKPLTATFKVT